MDSKVIYSINQADWDSFSQSMSKIMGVPYHQTEAPTADNITHLGTKGGAIKGEKNPAYGSPGASNPMHGKVRPDLVEFNKSRKGKCLHTKQSKEKLRNAFLGDKNPMYGKTHSPDARIKISEAAKKRKFSKVQCPHCLKVIGTNNRHWHFEKCKFKPLAS